MIQSFFFISNTGEIIIEKHWRGIIDRNICDIFWDEVNKNDSKEETSPIIATSKYFLISIFRDDVFLLAVTTREIAPLLVIEFLHRVFDTFVEYFGSVEENVMKENFATVYQLLEEMMDYGYPLTTEPNTLKELIKPASVITRLMQSTTIGSSLVSDELPDGSISNMPWRKTGVKYTQNEIYLDIIEEIDAIVDRHGITVATEVNGQIAANSQLSGIPDLSLAFLNPDLLDDCSFHPCVRYNRFDRDRVVSFVPPDGVFELMRYRVSIGTGISSPCYCQPQLIFDHSNGQGQLNLSIGLRSQHSLLYPGLASKPILVAEDVALSIPFSRSIRTASNITVNMGTVLFDEATKVLRWTVGKVTLDKVAQLSGIIYLQPGEKEESPTASFHWKVPSASVSGLSVASLQLTSESYKPYKGVRSMAQAGKYTIRLT